MSNRISIAEATPQQLRSFATTVLGLELEGRENGPTLRSKIEQAGWTGDNIPVMGEAPSGPPAGSRDAREASKIVKENGRAYFTIIIPREDKPGGQEPVYVSINGRGMFIPRGERQEVPAEYVEALDHAEQHVYDEFDGNGLGGLKAPRKVKSYPFTYA